MYVYIVFLLSLGSFFSRYNTTSIIVAFQWKHLGIALQDPRGKDQLCRDIRNDCEILKPFCTSHQERLKTSCKKTCGFCECKDSVADCPKYEQYCNAYGAQLKGYCDKTCSFCEGATITTPRPTRQPLKVCKDTIPDCNRLAKYCENSGDSLRGYCDMTCGFCIKPSEKPESILDGDCVDRRSDCGTRLIGYCNETMYEDRMKFYCRKTCGFCVPCVDKYKDYLLCARGKVFNKCDTDHRMLHNCRRTCGFCAIPLPPLCSKSKYGCCWDRQTTKRTEDGRNCPPCIDNYQTLCERFEEDCRKRDNDNGRFMRKHCPETCKLCTAKCIDDPIVGFQCKYWKEKNGWCGRQKQDMLFFCPRTCGFC